MEYELYHFGIKGMKWGVRRFQNKNGGLTPAGKKRYSDADKTNAKIRSINEKTAKRLKKIHAEGKAAVKIGKAEERAAAKIARAEAKYQKKSKTAEENKPKTLKDMTDDEIRARINRVRLENELKSLTPQQISTGKRIMNSLGKDVIAPAARDAGKNLLTKFLNKKGAELLGLDSKTTEDAFAALQKEVKTLQLVKAKDQLEKEGYSLGGKKPKKDKKPKNDNDNDNDNDKDDDDDNKEEAGNTSNNRSSSNSNHRSSSDDDNVEHVSVGNGAELVDGATGRQSRSHWSDDVASRYNSGETREFTSQWRQSSMPMGNVLGTSQLSLGRDFVYEIVQVGDD